MKLHNLIQKVLKTIEKYSMIDQNQGIVVALSGGPASVFLLHALMQLKRKFNMKINALHVHHGLRGAEADDDAASCKSLSESAGIPFLEIHRDVPGFARKKKISFEEAGRIIRLETYREAMEMVSAHRVATGHTADDQAETILMRIITGVGKTGLAGIYPVYEKFLIRPLLEIKKSEIIDYLEKNNIPFRVDRTNLELHFLRSRIRNLLIPFLKENFNPRIEEALCRMAALFREEADFLRKNVSYYLDHYLETTKSGVRLDTSRLTTLSPYIIKQILREAALTVKGDLKDISFYHMENLYHLLDKPSGSSIQIPGKLRAEKEYRYIKIEKKTSKSFQPPDPILIEFPGEYILDQWNILIRGTILSGKITEFNGFPHKAYFDADAIGEGSFILRTRRAGDRFFPLGATGSCKLKDFFINQKIPRWQRDLTLLLEKDGVIVWVVEIRPCEKFKVQPETKRVLMVQIEKF